MTTGSFSSPQSITFAFTNNTGGVIGSLAVSFDYEKTRSGTRQFDWTFFHGSSSNPTTSASAGDQSYPADANNTTISNPPLTTSKSFTIGGLSIANGATYYLRWTYTGLAGSTNSQGLGLDNFSITASAPFTTANNGDWNTGATWTGGSVPPAGSTVIINHAVTLAAALTNTGAVTISSGASLTVSNTYTNSGTTTVAGTFQINTGGSVAGTGLIFNTNSLLKYNVNATYGRSNEWTASSGTNGTTTGYPFSVQLSNNSVLNFPNGSSVTRAMGGDLTIDTGSALYQDFSSGSAALVVGGSVTVNGNLSLGAAAGGDITLGGNWTRGASSVFTANGRAVIFNGSGAQTVAVAGGSESFPFLTVGGSGTLTLSSATPTNLTVTGSGGVTLSSTNATSTINLNGQQMTVSGGGNMSLSSGNRFITGSSGSAFNVTTSTLTVATGGTLTFGDNVALVLSSGFNAGANLTTVGGGASGTLQINSGGFIQTNAPRYATGSTLLYNSGGTYGRSAEWTAATGTNGTTASFPFSVRVGNNTTLNYPNGTTIAARTVPGNLTVDAGSAFYMDFGSPTTVGALTVGGSVTLNGALSLGNVAGGDLNVAGNWTFNTGATFNTNTRAVTFNGSTAQTIGGTASTTFSFLTINNTSGTGASAGVSLSQPATVAIQLTLTAGVLVTTNTNIVLVSATGTSAVSGGSATAFVSGPIARLLPSNLASGSTYVFPTGKAGASAVYIPFELVNPTTVAGASVVIQAEGFNANSGGSSPALVLNNNRYWATSITSNSANFINTSIRVTDAGIGSANVLASSATLAGTNYTSIGGTVVSNSILSGTVTAGNYLQFLAMANSSPAIQATPSALTGLNYVTGFGPSASQSYSLSGNNLTPTSGSLTVTGSTNYEVSTDNTTFGASATVPYTGGALASTPVYVRLKAGLAAGSYNGENVTNTGGGATLVNVTCSGSVTAPNIATTGTLAAFSTDEGTASASQSFTASGTSLLADIVVTAPSGFEVALSSGGPYSASLNLTPTANTVATTSIFVRLTAAATAGTYTGDVTLTSTGATTRTVNIPTSTVRPLAPTLQASAASVSATGSTTATVSWTRGNGANVIVLMKSGSAVDANPANNTSYTASAAFGSGSLIGGANRVIYSGTGTSVAVTALSAATTYHVAVYEFNGTGSNVTYNTTAPARASAATQTNAPATPTFTAVAAASFTVNWTAVTGANGYQLDVATDAGFTTFVSGFNNLAVAGTSQSVTGLAANTAYFARVRARNVDGVASANSNTGTQTTSQLSAPVATAATLNTTTGFQANWNAVAGATDYRVDVYRRVGPTTTDLIISEYVEGSGNNKYVEIYNGTGATVNLANYELRTYANGGLTPTTSALSGSLTAGAVVVYRNSGATAYAGASTSLGAINYNGNDAVALFKTTTSSFVDIVGRIGEDPGTAWTAAGGYSTLDKTLRRKATVTSGVSTNPASGFPTLATEWDLFNIDDVTGLGTHTAPVYDYTDLSSSGATSLAITGLQPSTTYFYVVRAFSTSSTSSNSNEISTATLVVPMTLVAATPPLTAFSTTYGTASSPQVLNVSASGAVANVVVTAPAGYEIALTSGGGYSSSLSLPPSGGNVSESLNARIAALTPPGSLSGNFTATTTGGQNPTLATTGTVNKATPGITVTGATTFTYNKTPQGPSGTSVTGVSGGIAPSGAVTLAYSGTGLTTYGPSATAPTDAGTYEATASIATDANYLAASSAAFGFSIDPASLAITADAGQFKNKGAADPTLTYGQSGLFGGDSLTGALVRNGGEAPGVYPINLGTLSAGSNYTINYTGANFAIAGPLGAADATTKPTDSTAIKIPISSLLANDTRVTPAGATVNSSLSLTSVSPGTGNGVTIGGAFVFFTPNPSVSNETFSYTLTDTSNGTTDTVTVTVTTAAPDTSPFTINLVYAAAATYDGMQTTKTVDFIAVPGQSIIVEYSTDMMTWSQANGGSAINTGASGSFSATLTAPGDQTGTWNTTMFFRGKRP
ncbi:MAG: lamin tail domain-containing protein [Verrucomicrobia bacterium]|nr:lamin tail domain-containing protein [Verrucomicrobiota bacterium]